MPPKSLPVRPAAGGDLRAVERFAGTATGLQRLLALPAASDRELVLRAEMRRTIARLAAALDEAALHEQRTAHATVYRGAAILAAHLAAARPRGPRDAGSDH